MLAFDSLRALQRGSSLLHNLASNRVLVNVFLLSIVDPYQGFDRLDHTLRISN